MSTGGGGSDGSRGDDSGQRPVPDPAGPEPGAGQAAAEQPPALRLVGTLGSVAVVAGLAIVLVFQWAQPRIQAHRARELRAAIQEVLGEPEDYAARWVVEGDLVDSLPPGTDSASATRVYAGFDARGELVGYAVTGEKPGYQDVIRLIFGYDPRSEEVLGMKVLESKETPGLGAKITSDSAFVAEFRRVEPPLQGVKEGGDGPHQVDMITGATISSETVIEIINERLRAVGGPLRRSATGRSATGPPGATPPGRSATGRPAAGSPAAAPAGRSATEAGRGGA